MATERKHGLIACTACGKDCLILWKPAYEGFKKVGEVACCSSCGHEYKDGEPVPFVEKPAEVPGFLAPGEKKPLPKVLGEADALRFCMYCEEYIENPFTQRCVKHRREVQATDTCRDFKRKGTLGEGGPAL